MPTKYNVIVCGSRFFQDLKLASEKIHPILQGKENVCLISGGASGGDLVGELYATANNIEIKRFIPNWEKHGKAAGPIRNSEMIKEAYCVIAFWDGKSAGTRDTINKAIAKGIELHVFIF